MKNPRVVRGIPSADSGAGIVAWQLETEMRVDEKGKWSRVVAVALGASLAAFGAACDGGARADNAADTESAIVTIGPESATTVRRDEIRTGPLLSGEMRPEREATMRAEMGGSVVEVNAETGQPVRKGAVLARIEAHYLEDNLVSAQSAVKSAQHALQVARREAERTVKLVQGGALAQRDLEIATNQVSAAEAQLADAQARMASARKQLDDTVVRSPVTGIVSKRVVNAGDIVAPGAELLTIIDPSSMRLEAAVPSEALGSLRVGASVEFQVRGYPGQIFSGHIERISPVADPITRQVPILVSIPNTRGRIVAGLFAEGRVTTESKQALVVPASAVETNGSSAWVLRVRDGRAERVDVQVGVRDERTERVEIVAGLSEGDVLLTGAGQSVTPGTPVRIVDRDEVARSAS
ncbi:MAG: efflux RND transporter periplasmic adaptor subunit [Vicinamibacterales bacterium]